MPIIQIMDLHPLPRHDQRGGFPGTGIGGHQEILIVEDAAMGTHAIPLQPQEIRLMWTLPQRLMHVLLIDGIGPLAEPLIEVWKGPHREAFGVNRLGYQARMHGPLGIPTQGMNERGIRGPEQALDDRAKAGLGAGTGFFGAIIAGQQTNPSDRKSTRLNSSHDQISYAVFCLKKKKKN